MPQVKCTPNSSSTYLPVPSWKLRDHPPPRADFNIRDPILLSMAGHLSNASFTATNRLTTTPGKTTIQAGPKTGMIVETAVMVDVVPTYLILPLA